MIKKNPFLSYCLVWLSFGIYGFVWAWQIMDLINNVKSEKIYNTKIIFTRMAIFFIWDLFLISIMFDHHWLFGIIFLQHIAWIIFIFWGIYHMSKQLRLIEEDVGIKKTISEEKSVLLMFLYFTAIIYIQRHANKIIKSIKQSQHQRY